MGLLLNLSPELESELAAEAAQFGLPLSEYAIRVLSGERTVRRSPGTGAELVAYWQSEGLVGTRPEISDPSAHARDLRERAEKRPRA